MEEKKVEYDAFDTYLEDLELKLFEATQTKSNSSDTNTEETERKNQ